MSTARIQYLWLYCKVGLRAEVLNQELDETPRQQVDDRYEYSESCC